MSEVASSLFFVVFVSVFPLLVFLAILFWRRSPPVEPRTPVADTEAEILWRKALSTTIYAATCFLLLSAASFFLLLESGAGSRGALPGFIVPIVQCAIALFHFHIVASQISLGWAKAKRTLWARYALRDKLLPEPNTNQSPITFGENGAVLK